MAISFIGIGDWNTGTTGVSPTYPDSYTAIENDLAVVSIVTKVADTDEFSTPAGWTPIDTVLNEIGGTDQRHTAYYKVLEADESLPTWSGDTVDIAGGFCMIFRGVKTDEVLDASAVTSQANNTNPWTPDGITTATDGAMAISLFGSSHGGTTAMSAAQSFTEADTFNTFTATNVSMGASYREVSSAGSVTAPTWNRTSATGAGQWTGITLALKPAPPVTTATAVGNWGALAGSADATPITPAQAAGTWGPLSGSAQAIIQAGITAVALGEWGGKSSSATANVTVKAVLAGTWGSVTGTALGTVSEPITAVLAGDWGAASATISARRTSAWSDETSDTTDGTTVSGVATGTFGGLTGAASAGVRVLVVVTGAWGSLGATFSANKNVTVAELSGDWGGLAGSGLGPGLRVVRPSVLSTHTRAQRRDPLNIDGRTVLGRITTRSGV